MIILVEHLTVAIPSEIRTPLRHDCYTLGNKSTIKIAQCSKATRQVAGTMVREWLVVAALANALED